MENENLISDVTNGEVTQIPYGGDIPQIGFSVNEWLKSYGPDRPESTKKLERYYRDKCNEERNKNGLQPI